MSSSVSLPTRPKSTRPIRPPSSTRMFAGCGSAWKKPCRKIIAIQVSVIRYASSRRSSAASRLELEVGELHAVEELERQHLRPGVAPVDLRDDDDVRVGEVAPERVGVARLEPVVELLADRARELVDEVVDVDEVERADTLPDQAGSLVEEGEVVLDLTRRVRALHLDDDLVAVRKDRPVHLADRRGRDRRLVELDERLLERQARARPRRPRAPVRTGTARRRPGARAARRRCPAARRRAASRAAGRT